jgi:hypothetical protein
MQNRYAITGIWFRLPRPWWNEPFFHAGDFIKIAPENPILWTGIKGASAESRRDESDAETSSA